MRIARAFAALLMFHGNGKQILTPGPDGPSELKDLGRRGGTHTMDDRPQAGRNVGRKLTVIFAGNPRKHGQQDVNDD
jgi:hypothetical protein